MWPVAPVACSAVLVQEEDSDFIEPHSSLLQGTWVRKGWVPCSTQSHSGCAGCLGRAWPPLHSPSVLSLHGCCEQLPQNEAWYLEIFLKKSPPSKTFEPPKSILKKKLQKKKAQYIPL